MPVVSLGSYSGAWLQEIRNFKFHGQTDLGTAMGCLLWKRLKTDDSEGRIEIAPGLQWVVAGAPSSPSRNAQRGFEPAAVIAEALSESSGLKLADSLFSRLEGPAQREAPAEKREENARLILPGPALLSGALKRTATGVILVDDVATTMASLRRMAELLMEHGAERVICAVAGRTPLESSSSTGE